MRPSQGTHPQPPALFTDLYELTMAYGYWKRGWAKREATFEVFFRRSPWADTPTLSAGIETLSSFIEGFRFEEPEISYLAGLRDSEGSPLFDPAFLDVLRTLRFEGDLDAVPEGVPVFPQEPLLRVTAPLPIAQILETAILNMFNFQSLIATKAARVVRAARGAPVLEFGARRAQGPDGALSASRASYIGGCAGTSNVWAGYLYGIPVRGTVAHSWVMAFENELEAFEAFAEACPGNVILLVDTYDTLRGVRRAIEIGRRLKERGHRLLGVRLDSGDIEDLSREARKLLDEAGFEDTAVLASGDLDEYAIEKLRSAGAPVGAFGVGTRLATSWDEPALGGVYKLTAVREADGSWSPRMKRSETAEKASLPGRHAVKRFYGKGGVPLYDVISLLDAPGEAEGALYTLEGKKAAGLEPAEKSEDLLVPVFRSGRRVLDFPPLEEVRKRALEETERFASRPGGLAAPFTVYLAEDLHQLRRKLYEKLAKDGA